MLSIMTTYFAFFIKYVELSATMLDLKHSKSVIPTKTKAL